MICNTCKCIKDENDFSFANKKKGIRRGSCKECAKIAVHEHYLRNKDQYRKRSKKSKIVYQQRNVEYIYEYLKSHPCIECTEDDPLVLDFDHIDPNIKVDSISKLVCHGHSLESIKEEIKKCNVLCANCHRRKTMCENNSLRYQLWMNS